MNIPKALLDVIWTDDTAAYFDSVKSTITDEQINQYRTLSFSVEALPISSRIVNDWDAQGLINDSRDGDKGWRRFSVFDVALIEIFKALRGFDFSRNRLKTVKNSLTTKIDKRLSLLEMAFFTASSPMAKANIYLMIDEDARCNIVRKSDAFMSMFGLMKQSILFLNLNMIFGSYPATSQGVITFDDERLRILSLEDLDALAKLNTPDVDAVLSRVMNPKVSNFTFDKKKKFITHDEEHDGSTKPEYGEIKTIYQDDKVVKQVLTVKEKIDVKK